LVVEEVAKSLFPHYIKKKGREYQFEKEPKRLKNAQQGGDKKH